MKIPEANNSIAALIDRKMEETREEPRPHLGASLLGHPCDRYLWLSFRWAVFEKFEGRMLRLFRRGQREEYSIVEDLRSIGIEIHSTGGEQSRVDFGSHVSGSIDGIIESGVPEAPKKRHVAEFKTHNEKSFKDLISKGVKESKPRHWCQMQVYMLGTGIDRALYVAINKNDDTYYTERVRFDKEAAQALVDRGHRIALSDRLPEPLSADPTWWQCKFCPCCEFCHKTHLTREINCRTCAHATATKDSTFTCARYGGAEIPEEAQRTGCACHVLHPELVPWKVLQGSEDGFSVCYEINGRPVWNGEGDANVYASVEIIGHGAEEETGEAVTPF
jgi:hypothetical protein